MIGVFGELLVTAGVLVLLFIGWQTWWQSSVLAAQQNSAAAQQSQKYLNEAKKSATPAPTPTTKVAPDGTTTKDYGTPPVMTARFP